MAYDPQKPIKRLRYFTGQFLEDVDFTDEQKYHIGMLNRSNHALYYSAGILDNGFAVTLEAGAAGEPDNISIAPGVGVDADGRQIIILQALKHSLADASNMTVFVTLKWAEEPADEQTPADNDLSDYTRYQEIPDVRFIQYTSNDQKIRGDQFIIAKVTVTSDGKLSGAIDSSLRQYANAKFMGKLGIGTTTPNSPLEVMQTVNSLTTGLQFGGQHTPRVTAGGVINSCDANGNVRPLTIQSNGGNVGIGTTNPRADLIVGELFGAAISGGSGGGGVFGSNLATNNGGDLYTPYEHNSNYGYAGVQATWGSLKFYTSEGNTIADGSVANAPRMTIDKDGRVGIGTTSTGAPLSIAGDKATTSIETKELLHLLRPFDPNVKNHNSVGFRVGAYEAGISGASRLDINVAGLPDTNNNWGLIPEITVMTLQGNGRVGIGTTDPRADLIVGAAFGAAISGGSGGGGVFGSNLATNNGGDLYTPYEHNSNYGYAGVQATWGSLKFYTSDVHTTADGSVTNAPRMTIDKDGDVGIGTLNPRSLLHISGNAGVMALEGTDHAYIEYYSKGYSNERKAWVGFGSNTTSDFTIANEISNGSVVIPNKLSVMAGVTVHGNLQLTGSNPDANVGFKSTLTPANIVKAWGIIGFSEFIDGAIAPDLGSGFNVISVVFTPDQRRITVTLADNQTIPESIVCSMNTAVLCYVPARSGRSFEISIAPHNFSLDMSINFIVM